MRCEVCNRPRLSGELATTLRPTGVVGERRVVDHCADRLVCRVAAADPQLWNPGDRSFFDE